jgi:hypothetical protein
MEAARLAASFLSAGIQPAYRRRSAFAVNEPFIHRTICGE